MKPGQDRIVSHTDAEWTSMDPVLADGEIGINRNGGRMKYGDGVTRWSALPYLDQNFAVKAEVAAVSAQLDDVRTRVADVRSQVDAIEIQMKPPVVTPTTNDAIPITTTVVGP